MRAVKGVIVAGGRAAGPVPGAATAELVPVANRPLLHHALDALAVAGVEDVALVLAPAVAEEIRASVGDGTAWRLRIAYLELPEPCGVASALVAARGWLDGASFVAQVGDGLLRRPLRPYLERLVEESLDAFVLMRPDAEAVSPGDRASRLVDCADDPGARPRLAGVHFFGPRVFDAIRRLRPSWRGELEMGDALASLVRDGARVKQEVVDGWWRYGGHDYDLLEANRLLLDDLAASPATRPGSQISGRVAIHPTARIESSTICGPVVIGAGALVSDAYIGPYTSIGDEVHVEGTEIEDSMVFAGASVVNLGRRLSHSVVGRNARLFRSFALPASMRLRVGDGTEVSLA
jgi:glucose-1-phosphate thymidylyltransferase